MLNYWAERKAREAAQAPNPPAPVIQVPAPRPPAPVIQPGIPAEVQQYMSTLPPFERGEFLRGYLNPAPSTRTTQPPQARTRTQAQPRAPPQAPRPQLQLSHTESTSARSGVLTRTYQRVPRSTDGQAFLVQQLTTYVRALPDGHRARIQFDTMANTTSQDRRSKFLTVGNISNIFHNKATPEKIKALIDSLMSQFQAQFQYTVNGSSVDVTLDEFMTTRMHIINLPPIQGAGYFEINYAYADFLDRIVYNGSELLAPGKQYEGNCLLSCLWFWRNSLRNTHTNYPEITNNYGQIWKDILKRPADKSGIFLHEIETLRLGLGLNDFHIVVHTFDDEDNLITPPKDDDFRFGPEADNNHTIHLIYIDDEENPEDPGHFMLLSNPNKHRDVKRFMFSKPASARSKARKEREQKDKEEEPIDVSRVYFLNAGKIDNYATYIDHDNDGIHGLRVNPQPNPRDATVDLLVELADQALQNRKPKTIENNHVFFYCNSIPQELYEELLERKLVSYVYKSRNGVIRTLKACNDYLKFESTAKLFEVPESKTPIQTMAEEFWYFYTTIRSIIDIPDKQFFRWTGTLNYWTLARIIKATFEISYPNVKTQLPYKVAKLIHEHKFGGRQIVARSDFNAKKQSGFLQEVDINSMYPAIMARCLFPLNGASGSEITDSSELEELRQRPTLKYGWYRVDLEYLNFTILPSVPVRANDITGQVMYDC